ncbi:MAG TPA: hypothetical protein VN924_12195 [Bryobacteraceae bacterium]|nr:hypothetical protein [Bryobacteraceae bacterium]
MVVSAEVLCSQIGYTVWASRLLVEAAGELLTQDELTRDFGAADKSVLGTLVRPDQGAPPVPSPAA